MASAEATAGGTACDGCCALKKELERERARSEQLRRNLEDSALHREVAGLKRSLAKKALEEEKMRDKIFTAELQRDAALVKFHTEGQKLICRIQVRSLRLAISVHSV